MPIAVRQLSPLFRPNMKDFSGGQAAVIFNRDCVMVAVVSIVGLTIGLTLAFFVPVPEALAALL